MTMKITAATFAACSVGRDSMPKDGKPVFAMIGRSNVGKSSMINTLVGRRELAKTSSTPGKTLTLNYYLINESFYLVDLPGFGFAKASKVTRDRVHQMVTDFFEIADTLCGIIHVLDVRHLPSNLDLEMRKWIEEQQFRYLPILTKIDKLSQNDLAKMVRAITKKINVPSALLFSSKSSQGREEIIDVLEFALSNPDAGPLLLRGAGMRPLKKRMTTEPGRGGARPEHRHGPGGGRPQQRPAAAPVAPAAGDAGSPNPEGDLQQPAVQPEGTTGPAPQGGGQRPAQQNRDGRRQGGQRPPRERRPDQQRGPQGGGQGGPRPQGQRPQQQGGQPSGQQSGQPAGQPSGQSSGQPGPNQPGQQPQNRNRHRPHHRRRDGQGGNPPAKPGTGGSTPSSGNPGSDQA